MSLSGVVPGFRLLCGMAVEETLISVTMTATQLLTSPACKADDKIHVVF